MNGYTVFFVEIWILLIKNDILLIGDMTWTHDLVATVLQALVQPYMVTGTTNLFILRFPIAFCRTTFSFQIQRQWKITSRKKWWISTREFPTPTFLLISLPNGDSPLFIFSPPNNNFVYLKVSNAFLLHPFFIQIPTHLGNQYQRNVLNLHKRLPTLDFSSFLHIVGILHLIFSPYLNRFLRKGESPDPFVLVST